MTGFKNKVAVVTGAAGGMGEETARRLATRGAVVWAVDIAFTGSSEESVGSGRIISRRVDVTDSRSVDALFEEIAETTGPASLLANVAGGPGRQRSPIDEVTDEDWHRVVALNLDAAFYCTRAAARWMKRFSIPGAMVIVSSGAGRTYSRTGVQAYSSAKAGAIGLTRQLARELGPFGIRVNCVAPGLIDVSGIREELAAMSDEAMATHLSGAALGRLGQAADVAGPIIFFLGEEAGYVSGQTISVDGGATMLG